jgi:hypothetical protein
VNASKCDPLTVTLVSNDGVAYRALVLIVLTVCCVFPQGSCGRHVQNDRAAMSKSNIPHMFMCSGHEGTYI